MYYDIVCVCVLRGIVISLGQKQLLRQQSHSGLMRFFRSFAPKERESKLAKAVTEVRTERLLLFLRTPSSCDTAVEKLQKIRFAVAERRDVQQRDFL
jgi:hypothetical protein